jgi:hypothetical protein
VEDRSFCSLVLVEYAAALAALAALAAVAALGVASVAARPRRRSQRIGALGGQMPPLVGTERRSTLSEEPVDCARSVLSTGKRSDSTSSSFGDESALSPHDTKWPASNEKNAQCETSWRREKFPTFFQPAAVEKSRQDTRARYAPKREEHLVKATTDFRGTLSWRRTPTFERRTAYSKAADRPLRPDLRARLLRNRAPFRRTNNMSFPRFPCLFFMSAEKRSRIHFSS